MIRNRSGEPGASRSRSKGAIGSVVLASLLLFGVVRILFMLHNPDWSVIGAEHCFFLTLPQVHADRQAVEPDGDIPFWLVNPTQFRAVLHGGAAWIAHCTRVLCQLLDTRSLVVVKIVGTAHAAVFVAMLAWALSRVFDRRSDRYQVWVPLFLCAVPPVFFLWVTLLPMGHYFESHVFYGLFLPLVVSVSGGRASWALLVYAGCLAGVAIVYSFSNVFFLIHAVALCLLFVRRPVVHRVAAVAGLLAIAGGIYAIVGRPGDVAARLLGSALLAPAAREAAGLGAGSTLSQLLPSVQDHVEVLFGPWDDARFLPQPLGLGVAVLFAGLAAAAAGTVLAWTVRAMRRLRRHDLGRREVFLAAHGLLLLLFGAAYLAFDPYTRSRGNSTFIFYLTPLYPVVFVGCGAMLSSLARLERPWATWSARLIAVAGGALLLGATAGSLSINARDIHRPEFGSCDARYLYGYFLDEPSSDSLEEGAPPLWEGVAVVAPEAGEARCRAARPDNGDACALVGYALAAMHGAAGPDCASEPGPRAEVCARGVGAARYGCGAGELAPDGTVCQEFEGSLRDACISGAHQALHPDVPSCPAIGSFLELCDRTFEREPARSSCWEQVSALMLGAPALPPAPARTAPACVDWPEPWIGLCQQAADHPGTLRRGSSPASCDVVYREGFSEEIPAWSSLAFEQCLSETVELYPYCAIGVARAAGRTDCVWGGGWENR